jgi:hypothetical protein
MDQGICNLCFWGKDAARDESHYLAQHLEVRSARVSKHVWRIPTGSLSLVPIWA